MLMLLKGICSLSAAAGLIWIPVHMSMQGEANAAQSSRQDVVTHVKHSGNNHKTNEQTGMQTTSSIFSASSSHQPIQAPNGIVVRGTVVSVGNSSVTLKVNGTNETFAWNGDTHFSYTFGPIQAPTSTTDVNNASRMKPGDSVMVLEKGGIALEILDQGTGTYQPLGKGSIPMNSTSSITGAHTSGGFSGSISDSIH